MHRLKKLTKSSSTVSLSLSTEPEMFETWTVQAQLDLQAAPSHQQQRSCFYSALGSCMWGPLPLGSYILSPVSKPFLEPST